jgi:hypothetical protein
MLRQISFVLGFVLAACSACGDSEDDPLTAEEIAARGVYCCYENGLATSDSAPACAKGAQGCVWSETSDNVDAAGRGRMCGYLACH